MLHISEYKVLCQEYEDLRAAHCTRQCGARIGTIWYNYPEDLQVFPSFTSWLYEHIRTLRAVGFLVPTEVIMELIATTNDAQMREIHMSIRKMIRKGYRENQAIEAHTPKISFPRIPQLKWPSSRLDGQSGHHYHLKQVPSDIEVNTQTGFALVYHILLNFEKSTIAYNSQDY